MTALILQVTPFAEIIARRLRAICQRLLRTLDAFAEARMRNAVPELELRRARREINRYHRLMHAHQRTPVKSLPAGR